MPVGQQVCAAQRFDLLGLSNLCVDVVVNVDKLPGPDKEDRLRLLHQVRDMCHTGCLHTPATAAAL